MDAMLLIRERPAFSYLAICGKLSYYDTACWELKAIICLKNERLSFCPWQGFRTGLIIFQGMAAAIILAKKYDSSSFWQDGETMIDDKRKEEQIEQLYREMHQTLFACAKSVLKDGPLAEEAVQDTFCIACAKSDQVLLSQNPKGWLICTLKHVMQNMNRQRAKLGQLLSLSMAEDMTSFDEESVDILYGDIADQADFQLLKRIVLDRCTMLEAAEELGISVDACKKRIQRIKKYLRKKFSDY